MPRSVPPSQRPHRRPYNNMLLDGMGFLDEQLAAHILKAAIGFDKDAARTGSTYAVLVLSRESVEGDQLYRFIHTRTNQPILSITEAPTPIMALHQAFLPTILKMMGLAPDKIVSAPDTPVLLWMPDGKTYSLSLNQLRS